MDTAEEELRQKLAALERRVCDPSLQGRAEEIWARMVSVRERGRQLQFEMERLGVSGKGEEQVIDEETMKKARKVCDPSYPVQRYGRQTKLTSEPDLGRLSVAACTSSEGVGADSEGVGGVGGQLGFGEWASVALKSVDNCWIRLMTIIKSFEDVHSLGVCPLSIQPMPAISSSAIACSRVLPPISYSPLPNSPLLPHAAANQGPLHHPLESRSSSSPPIVTPHPPKPVSSHNQSQTELSIQNTH